MDKRSFDLDNGQYSAQPKREELSPKTKAKREQQFSENKKTGVELRRKVNDDFQDFMDFVEECSVASEDKSDYQDGDFRPDPEKEDLFTRKMNKSTQPSMPKHFGEIPPSHFDLDREKVNRPERKIGGQSYKELAALPPKKQFWTRFFKLALVVFQKPDGNTHKF